MVFMCLQVKSFFRWLNWKLFQLGQAVELKSFSVDSFTKRSVDVTSTLPKCQWPGS
jgi:hypothetical protein